MERNQKILYFRNKGHTLREIAKAFNLSTERVRQVLLQKVFKHCKRHNIPYAKVCKYCASEDGFNKKMKNISKDNLLKEITLLSRTNRQKENVLKKSILVKTLFNKYKLNYSQIGKLLHKDHTSIMHLYRKKI